MTVQDIINASSTDFRSVLSNSSPDSALFVSWVDRIHKDALQTGVYNYLTNVSQNVSITSGTSSYTIPISAGGIRRINLVYDRTFDRVILPVEAATYPTNEADGGSPRQKLQFPIEMLNADTMSQYPKYFKLEEPHTLIVFPAPQKAAFAGTYEVHYEIQVPDLTATTDTLLIPNDAINTVVAGVNQYVAQYLHLDTDMQFWAQQYQAMKLGTANN